MTSHKTWLHKFEAFHLASYNSYQLIILKQYILRGNSPRPYTGPWDLSKDNDRSEEKQIVISYSQLKSHK